MRTIEFLYKLKKVSSFVTLHLKLSKASIASNAINLAFNANLTILTSAHHVSMAMKYQKLNVYQLIN